ncbi:MAG: hypothetical protein LBL41_03945 [Bifidobacteriaceae bacterium]|jgi:hypothetical protein|nr:hypothetical protein [Bifidobacteriaceae bacterium]
MSERSQLFSAKAFEAIYRYRERRGENLMSKFFLDWQRVFKTVRTD